MSFNSFFTKAVHAGENRAEHFGAVSVPIYPASLFAFADADEGEALHSGELEGYYYGRLGNPTVDSLEKTMAELENCEGAVAFASGMAAISAAVLAIVGTGDHIVAPRSGYSTTTHLFNRLAEQFAVEVSYIDATRAENYSSAVRPRTKLLWIETPSNPMVNITDLAQVADVARSHGITAVADNTFATPFNQRPCELGIDAVIHSATKYLGGHSDLTAGIFAGRRDLVDAVRNGPAKLLGGNIAPQVSWLVSRGIKTLALRMERHNSNAYAIANMLERHPKVAAVHYPGLNTHPGHPTAQKQMSGFGGMIALDLGTMDAGKHFANSVRLCTLATSLGGVETIVQHSASMTHASIPRDERLAAGITDGLIRLSVGIEDADDIIEDMSRAIDGI